MTGRSVAQLLSLSHPYAATPHTSAKIRQPIDIWVWDFRAESRMSESLVRRFDIP